MNEESIIKAITKLDKIYSLRELNRRPAEIDGYFVSTEYVNGDYTIMKVADKDNNVTYWKVPYYSNSYGDSRHDVWDTYQTNFKTEIIKVWE